jgi:hypothetical protein
MIDRVQELLNTDEGERVAREAAEVIRKITAAYGIAPGTDASVDLAIDYFEDGARGDIIHKLRFERRKVPTLQEIMAYKSVWALYTVTRQQKKATHYACVLVGGSRPTWGVWTVRHKFLRFYGGRTAIEKDYPQLMWQRRMFTWALRDETDKPVKTRIDELETRYHKKIVRD